MQYEQQERAIKGLTNFLHTPLEILLNDNLQADTSQKAIDLFHYVANSVPAYKNFLETHNINPSEINNFSDFQKLPLLNKDNYLRRYPLPQLCHQGKLEQCDMIAASSGSTGKPTFWGRFYTDELEIATRFEQIFHDSFHADTKSTLAVVCFSLGTWVGGMYTASCCRHLAAKGYPISVITPGNNKTEILRVVEELGNNFEQVVLLGYPPFLKDVIDTGIASGMEWRQYRIKLIMAGEVFSEEWRNLVCQRIDAENPYFDSASLYGTADAGVLGNETPLSICIRRFLANNPQAAKALFGESRLPTLVQYDPISRFFEVEDKTLLFSGDNGIPLIRYNILDHGGIITYDQMLQFLKQYDFDAIAQVQVQNPIAESGEKQRGIYPFPFAYIFGRSNFTISYFGANIYPENVTIGLEQPEIQAWVTGKFVMQVREDGDKNRFLFIAVELAPGIEDNQQKTAAVTSAILTQLKRLNSEFTNYVPPEYQTPQLQLFPTGNSEYFPIGVKHRYTRS
ncbi:MAG: phenylacetate--CoA ligase family protein [Cyanobacteria bacterium P01_A01_bin.84]